MPPTRTPETSPEISVVIPTYERETRLAFALDALAAQTLRPGRFEVIVVRDSERGPLTEPPPGLNARFLAVPAPGPAARRNAGWRAAQAPLVAFTDDDCRPVPSWLERLLAAWNGGDRILQGRTEPDPDESHLAYGIARTISIERLDRWFQTCNIAYPRATLERLGGFDEALAFHCEDTDLALRAEREGAVPVFVEDAVVYHAVHVRGVRQALAEAASTTGEPALVARFPEQRELLYLRTFVHRDHARLVLAAAGLALWPLSRPLALALTVPYLRARARRRLSRGRRISAWTPLRVALDTVIEGTVDTAEVANRLRSSVRHRRLVL